VDRDSRSSILDSRQSSALVMEGNPAEFEAIGSRLGFHVVEDTGRVIKLVWKGARFPAYLCVGIAVALLFISVPIVEAIHVRGFTGPASSLWYFPIMNLILFGISLYLVLMRRTIVCNEAKQQITLTKKGLFRKVRLTLDYSEIEVIRVGIDQVYSGFAVAGSSAAQSFPVPSIRLRLLGGDTVLVDRAGVRRLKPLAELLGQRLGKPSEVEPALR
jgi:hypothetical protein